MPPWISPWIFGPGELRIQWIRWILKSWIFWIDVVGVFWPSVERVLRPFQFRVFWVFRFFRRVIYLVRFLWLSWRIVWNKVLRRELRVKFWFFRDLWNIIRLVWWISNFSWFLRRRDQENNLRGYVYDNWRVLFCWKVRSVVRKARADSVRPNWRSKIREILIIKKWIVFERIPIRIEKCWIIE